MEELKQEFKHDYNEAIHQYNNGDSVNFFRNIRPAIEKFCRLVVYDQLGQELAEEVLSGTKTIKVDFAKCSDGITRPEHDVKRVENSALTLVAHQAIYLKNAEKLSKSFSDRIWNRIKSNLDSDFIKLRADFKNCSEAGLHSGESSVENETETQNLVTF